MSFKGVLKKSNTYDNLSPIDLLRLIPQNNYQLGLTDYYEKHIDFYNYFREKIRKKEKIELYEYVGEFFDWFRGVMAETDSEFIKYYKTNTFDSIAGSMAEEVLEQNEWLVETYPEIAHHIFEDSFGILKLCKEKNDYLQFYNKWHYMIINYMEKGYVEFERYYRATQQAKDEKIDGALFPYFANVHSNLTDVGNAYYDEICRQIKEELNQLFKETHTNFVYMFSEVYENEVYPLDPLSLFWKEHIGHNKNNIKLMGRGYGKREQKEIRKFIKKAENTVRDKAELPRIGEGWISETVLFKQVQTIFYDKKVEQHVSTKFLGKQHYDIYFPEHLIAIEYQGEQHFNPVDLFGGEEGLLATKERDSRKKKVSENNGVTLIEVTPDYDLDDLVDKLCDCISDYSYQKIYKEVKENIDKKTLAEEQRYKIINIKNVVRKSSSKTISEEDKEEAHAKLKRIKTRFGEGFWVELWYYGFSISNAEKLDYNVQRVDEIINELRNRKSKAFAFGEMQQYADCIKRGINYYKKVGLIDEAIELTEFAIANKLHLEKVKDFDKRLEELVRQKENSK